MTLPDDPLSHPLRRSVLCVPGSNTRALAKVPDLDCDAVIFDLEDAVAIDAKADARENLRRLFGENRPKGKELVIRINPLSDAFGEEDMALVSAVRPDAVLLPKLEETGELEAALSLMPAKLDAPIALWAMIETPKGVLDAAEIARKASMAELNLGCFVVGLNDLRKSSGVLPRPGRDYLVPWLMQTVLAARAFGIDVLDSVFNDFRDAASFETECDQGRAMGFSGKMLIHPAQIEPANRHFGPTPEAIAEARSIIAAFAGPEARTLNVINLDGRMVERLHLEEAARLMAKVDAITARKKVS